MLDATYLTIFCFAVYVLIFAGSDLFGDQDPAHLSAQHRSMINIMESRARKLGNRKYVEGIVYNY